MSTNPAQLSFVECQPDADGEPRVTNYWRPAADGSYAAQCQEGRRRASEAVDYISVTGALPVLAWIVGAMPRGRDMGGAEIGFVSGLAAMAVA